MSLNAFIALHNNLGMPVFVQHKPAVTVALVLANAASDDGFEFCTVDTLANRACMSRAAFQLHLQRLKAAGWVENVPARKQPKWVREKVGGTRIAVRRVPHVPTIGTAGVPMVGTEEVPMVGRRRNLKRGTTSPDGRDSRNPDDRDGRSPDGRDTDPAYDPACDPEHQVVVSMETRARETAPQPTPPAQTPQQQAWGAWCAMLSSGGDSAWPAEAAVIDQCAERFGAPITLQAIAALADTRGRPKAAWVMERAEQAHQRQNKRKATALIADPPREWTKPAPPKPEWGRTPDGPAHDPCQQPQTGESP